MSLRYICWAGLGLYALLSVADWTLTYALLRIHPGAVESNPVAAAFLEQHGWGGLAFYKAALVFVFAVAVVMIYRRRPAVATGIVTFGCAALVWVTVYSHGLLRDAHREAAARAETEWPTPRQTATNEFGVPERCWFAGERTPPPPVRVARRLPKP